MGDDNVFSPKPRVLLTSPVKEPLRPALKRHKNKGSSAGGSLSNPGPRVATESTARPPKAEMAASFLQFCAMCEKQIMTPCNNILYCSEACRRKDGCKPLSAANLTQLTPPSSIPSSPSRVFLLPRTPTGSYTDLSPLRIPPEIHSSKQDLDPTEWKPKLSHRDHLHTSEAFRFLSQFHQRSTSSTSINDTQSMIDDPSKNECNSALPASVPTPGLTFSLASTPTTNVSTSISTMSISGAYGYFNGRHNADIPGSAYPYEINGYDFNTRPLPPRHNRWYSIGGATPRGADLVTPHVAPPIDSKSTEATAASESLWGKKAVSGTSIDQGGMKALFRSHQHK